MDERKNSLEFTRSLPLCDFVLPDWLAADIWRIADGPGITTLLANIDSSSCLQEPTNLFLSSFPSYQNFSRSPLLPHISRVSLLSTRKGSVAFSRRRIIHPDFSILPRIRKLCPFIAATRSLFWIFSLTGEIIHISTNSFVRFVCERFWNFETKVTISPNKQNFRNILRFRVISIRTRAKLHWTRQIKDVEGAVSSHYRLDLCANSSRRERTQADANKLLPR